jgi:hypothetical protein
MNRRQFLEKALAATGFVSLYATSGNISDALASMTPPTGPTEYDLLIARVKYTTYPGIDQWNILPEGEQRLLGEFVRLFRCKVKLQKAYRRFGKPEEFNAVVDFENFPTQRMLPFVFMTGQLEYKLSQKAIDNLRRFVDRGGFLLMDDCAYRHEQDLFFKSSCEMLEKTFGRNFKVLENQHDIFHNVFDFETGLPHIQGVPHPAMAVVINDKVSVFLSSGDLHCGWIGRFFPEKGKFENAIKMGINILYYTLTG